MTFPTITDTFLKEEFREGHLVTSEMKAIWAIQLDLLQQLLYICKANNLTIWGCGGTLLGAIRHKGFIPWDDDIDMMMPRKDYDILCKIAPSFLKEPYFFQTEETDPGYLLRHAKIRNSKTTALQKALSKYNCQFNQGIFIDIFPLDKLPNDIVERESFYENLWSLWGKVWKVSAYKNRGYRTPNDNEIKDMLRTSTSQKLNMIYEKEVSKYKNTVCTEWCLIATTLTTQGITQRFLWEISDFTETTFADFEGIKLPIPKNYDNILTKSYGNWQQLIKGGSLHGEIFFDTKKSYKEYLNI